MQSFLYNEKLQVLTPLILFIFFVNNSDIKFEWIEFLRLLSPREKKEYLELLNKNINYKREIPNQLKKDVLEYF